MRPGRSYAYQHLFAEIPCGEPWRFENRLDERALIPPEDELRMDKLDQKIKRRFKFVVFKNLTDLQRNVLKMRLSGMTQVEIAKERGVNQSTIFKALSGNVFYRRGEAVYEYGGIASKITKVALTDDRLRALMVEMHALLREHETFARAFWFGTALASIPRKERAAYLSGSSST